MAAGKGHGRAAWALGTMHVLGKGVDQSNALAFANFQKSAAAGYAKGMTSLGVCCLEGRGTAKSEGGGGGLVREGGRCRRRRRRVLSGANYGRPESMAPATRCARGCLQARRRTGQRTGQGRLRHLQAQLNTLVLEGLRIEPRARRRDRLAVADRPFPQRIDPAAAASGRDRSTYNRPAAARWA